MLAHVATLSPFLGRRAAPRSPGRTHQCQTPHSLPTGIRVAAKAREERSCSGEAPEHFAGVEGTHLSLLAVAALVTIRFRYRTVSKCSTGDYVCTQSNFVPVYAAPDGCCALCSQPGYAHRSTSPSTAPQVAPGPRQPLTTPTGQLALSVPGLAPPPPPRSNSPLLAPSPPQSENVSCYSAQRLPSGSCRR